MGLLLVLNGLAAEAERPALLKRAAAVSLVAQ
jgi:hypothetical protein